MYIHTDRRTQHCSISATVRSPKNAHWSRYNVSNQYSVCHFTTANRRVYQQTIADLLFNDDRRQTAKSTVCRPLTLSDVTSHVA